MKFITGGAEKDVTVLAKANGVDFCPWVFKTRFAVWVYKLVWCPIDCGRFAVCKVRRVVVDRSLSHSKTIIPESGVYVYLAVYRTHAVFRIKPGPSISYKIASAPSEDSDKPAHPRMLISLFVVCLKTLWISGYPNSDMQRLTLDCCWTGWTEFSPGAHCIYIEPGHCIFYKIALQSCRKYSSPAQYWFWTSFLFEGRLV